MKREMFYVGLWILTVAGVLGSGIRVLAQSDPEWVEYRGAEGPGKGKHIVLISGDEEYRSEEALPQLAKILAKHHGFRCTVLFAVDPESGIINPNVVHNIPGLHTLEFADLMILFTRFRALPDGQMKQIDDYLMSGRPVIGIRTATHAFNFSPGRWSHYGNSYDGDKEAWKGGFGRLVLGERWVSHHGRHKHESTRGVIVAQQSNHPILRGLRDGDVWGPTDVYTVRLPLPGDSQALVLGQVRQRKGEFDQNDPFLGMRPEDGPPVSEKNDPMMPIAWTKTYRLPGGEQGHAFTSTIGSSTDLVTEGTRRLLVNAVYWCVGLEDKIPKTGTRVDLVGQYEFTAYESRDTSYWEKRQMRPSDHRLE